MVYLCINLSSFDKDLVLSNFYGNNNHLFREIDEISESIHRVVIGFSANET